MEFLKTVAEITNNIGEKANNSMEISRLNGKVSAKSKIITSLKSDIGSYCWEQYQRGDVHDTNIAEMCAKMKSAYADIEKLNAEIQEIKENTPSVIPKKQVPVCPGCGEKMEQEMKFCGMCGADLTLNEAPDMGKPEVLPASNKNEFCHSCGAKISEDMLYCGKCGVKL